MINSGLSGSKVKVAERLNVSFLNLPSEGIDIERFNCCHSVIGSCVTGEPLGTK